jgi:hypothetical protein
MSRITWTGIPARGFNIGLITIIFGPRTRTHLSAKEQQNPDQERGGHDQGRRQRLQIGEHAAPCRVGLRCLSLYFAL